ncbi:uncharacterized protein PHALS_04919 [Plasmopara halstedii]|uniref:Uncharacterized protein n=1 Tax=Plasmopara halstedii TaxID=4781 RepID=A0A0P1A978_PLAHL|nr:uncharacterized protein PHALS_04919 [Plasmopara halstedii]CEG37318.1 hypothetical protein PHALS_04919 [Plasmopara halstedii]|eukprot:XP_024573687.1 hypothetical protein PHALS_04919 [Plasmopara halstedii]
MSFLYTTHDFVWIITPELKASDELKLARDGEYGFVLLQEFQRADSVNSMCLPLKERQHLGEMERINNSIHDVENAVQLHETVKVLKQKRMHNQEYHERVPNEDEGRLTIRQHKAPKREFESRRKKCIRMRRVHQPK